MGLDGWTPDGGWMDPRWGVDGPPMGNRWEIDGGRWETARNLRGARAPFPSAGVSSRCPAGLGGLRLASRPACGASRPQLGLQATFPQVAPQWAPSGSPVAPEWNKVGKKWA